MSCRYMLTVLLVLCVLVPGSISYSAEREIPGLVLPETGPLAETLIAAQDKIAAGKYDEAVSLCREALEAKGESGPACYLMGEALRLSGRSEGARDYYLRAVKQDPDDRSMRARVMKRLECREAGPVPEDALVIFDDNFAPGCREYFSVKNARSDLEYAEPMYGVACWAQFRDPKQAYSSELDLRGAFASCGLEPPGDLRRLRQRGALVFWIKGSGEGLSCDIGFRMRETKSLARERMTENLLPLHHYVYVTREWQQVIIPLSDFPDNGYVWIDTLVPVGYRVPPRFIVPGSVGAQHYLDWNELVTEERETRSKAVGRPRRSERFFHWGRVGYLVQRGARTELAERCTWLDQVMVVPEYSEEKCRALKARAKERRAELWDADGLRLFGDDLLLGSWAYFSPYSSLVVDETTRREGKRSLFFAMDPRQWAGGGIEMGDVDLSPIREKGYLVFWVKGSNGGELFTPYLHARRGAGGRVTTLGPQVRHYRELTVDWQKVWIPLADFRDNGYFWDDAVTYLTPARFNWQRVIELTFEAPPVREVEHSWYMDDIRFVAGRENQ